MADEKPVSLEDVVEVLAKHAGTPVDPDDAATLARFNQETADDKVKQEESKASAQPKKGP